MVCLLLKELRRGKCLRLLPMNFSRILIVAGLMVVFQMKAMGTLWTGTITETVTQSDRADYPVGDVYVGTYQYVSDSVDGDFGQPRWRPVAPLTVDLYHFGLDVWLNSDTLIGNAKLQMIVLGGEVTFFHMDAEMGPSSFNFTTDSFNSLSSSYGSTVLETNIAGVLAFSAPIAANVPDRTNTVVGVAIGLAALSATRRIARSALIFPKIIPES